MKTLRKYISLLLCLCVSTYTLPVFASTTAAKAEFVKVELSDATLAQAVGGSGSVDATMVDYKGGVAKAVLVNRSSLYCDYTLNVVTMDGTLVQNLVTGNLPPGEAILVSGTPTDQNGAFVQAHIWNGGFTGLESMDTSVSD